MAGDAAFTVLGAAALAVLGSTVFAVAAFAALDFGAALGLEAAGAAFGDAGLDVVGDLAMYSPTPRFDQKRGGDGQRMRRIATIRHISGV
ncbi:hypothetical protein [Brevundimonas sp.]|uniref:hypothetical protein n=1 Tax=Brevundimonas sp. TaxID=1871086 RepID=UPI0028A0BD74|nr:hypothetical protein [Brevundimonas sp.]